MGYEIVNKNGARCISDGGGSFKSYDKNGYFFTIDINIAYLYKEILEHYAFAGMPFTVKEVYI